MKFLNKSYVDTINFIENVTLNKSLVSIDRKIVILNECVKVNDLIGDYAEFGVYKGGISKMILNCTEKGNVHLFDTFTGIPEDDVMHGGHYKNYFATDLTEVKSYINDDRAIFHVGIFPETAVDHLKFKCVHIDCDTYQSVIAGINYFWPRLVIGGSIIFDDLDWIACPGVRVALNEILPNEKIYTYANYQGVIFKLN